MWTSGAGHCIDMDQFAGPLAFIAHYRLRFEGGQPSKADAQHCSEPAGDSWAHSFDRRDGPGRRGAGLSSRIRASVMMHSLSARPEVRQTLGGCACRNPRSLGNVGHPPVLLEDPAHQLAGRTGTRLLLIGATS